MLKLKASITFFPLLSQKDFSFSAVCLLKPVRSRNGHVFSRAASHFLYSLLGTTCTRLQNEHFQTAVGLIPLCGHSFKSLLFLERCSICGTVNDCPILGVKLRLLKEDPGFVPKSKSRKVGSLGLPDLRFAGSLIRAGLRPRS